MSNKEQLRKQIIQLLQVMSEGENIIQCIKETLVMHEEFSPIVLFQTISNGKQRFTKEDMKKLLEKHSIQFSNDELRQYMRENKLGKQASFHEFIDSIMPFNADALRVYKESYLQKLAIRQQDPEVEIIYRQLMENQFKFIRSIDMIKNQIIATCRSDIWKVNQLIKTDLVGKSKIREAKKFQQKFDNPNSQISFIDLRRFLELHTPTHQVVLLNLMRKLRTDNPLKPINLRLQHGIRRASRSKSKNRSKERSAFKSKEKVKTNYDNYDDFKRKIEEQYEAQQNLSSSKKRSSKSKPKIKKQSQIRWQREKKNINGNLLKKLLETIISKQQLLQKQRKKLFQCKDFNMINLFKLMDVNNNGILSEDDVIRFVNKFSSSPKIDYKPLFQIYAKEQGLRFHQLYGILQPLSKQLVKAVANKQQNSIANPFRQKTINLIINILISTVQSLKQIISIKQQINDKGQDTKQLFSYIDINNKGQITCEDIKQLLQQDEFFTDQKDMKLLFKYMDHKSDKKVELQNFRKLVQI